MHRDSASIRQGLVINERPVGGHHQRATEKLKLLVTNKFIQNLVEREYSID